MPISNDGTASDLTGPYTSLVKHEGIQTVIAYTGLPLKLQCNCRASPGERANGNPVGEPQTGNLLSPLADKNILPDNKATVQAET